MTRYRRAVSNWSKNHSRVSAMKVRSSCRRSCLRTRPSMKAIASITAWKTSCASFQTWRTSFGGLDGPKNHQGKGRIVAEALIAREGWET